MGIEDQAKNFNKIKGQLPSGNRLVGGLGLLASAGAIAYGLTHSFYTGNVISSMMTWLRHTGPSIQTIELTLIIIPNHPMQCFGQCFILITRLLHCYFT